MLPHDSVSLIQQLFFEFTGYHSKVPKIRADENDFEPMSEPKATSTILCHFLNKHQVDYAIGGAIALNFWVAPRPTKDIDLYLFISPNEFDYILHKMESMLQLRILIENAHEHIVNGWAIPSIMRGVKVDILLPFASICVEAQLQKVQVRLCGTLCWILSAEILCILKLLYYRKKDVIDVQKIISTVEPLDIDYIRRCLIDMFAKNHTDRIDTFEKILSTVRQIRLEFEVCLQ